MFVVARCNLSEMENTIGTALPRCAPRAARRGVLFAILAIGWTFRDAKNGVVMYHCALFARCALIAIDYRKWNRKCHVYLNLMNRR
jgi:hypothetical protein